MFSSTRLSGIRDTIIGLSDRVGRETGSVRGQENESERSRSVSKRDRERDYSVTGTKTVRK